MESEFEDDDKVLEELVRLTEFEDIVFPIYPSSVTSTSLKSASCTNRATIVSLISNSGISNEFNFPFSPYPIQLDFMTHLYKVIENKYIGIFESPTGTGKSLSIICGSLTWLLDYEKKQADDLSNFLNSRNLSHSKNSRISESIANEPQWVSDFAVRQQQMEDIRQVQEEREFRVKQEEKLESLRSKVTVKDTYYQKRKRSDNAEDDDTKLDQDEVNIETQEVEHDDDDLVANYDSDGSNDDDVSEEEVNLTKVIFSSRTHSQLTQFIKEVKKTKFSDKCRVVCLASRQNLCIFDQVKRLSTNSLINDRCLELQKKSKSSIDSDKKRRKNSCSCPFFEQKRIRKFADSIVNDIQDIEDLVAKGKQLKACPYYASRMAVTSAQIVLVPYNILLHKPTRDACGLKLKDNVVIIDEAHNLPETLANIHSIHVSASQLYQSYGQVQRYLQRYASRLKAKNVMFIQQLLFIHNALVQVLGGTTDKDHKLQRITNTGTFVLSVNDFLYLSKMDNINLYRLLQYCDQSRIYQKMHGFVERYSTESLDKECKKIPEPSGVTKFLQSMSANKPQKDLSYQDETKLDIKVSSTDKTKSSPLGNILSFLHTLTNFDKHGRICLVKHDQFSNCSIKYLLLNPGVYFTDVPQEARSVVLAGGTMEPVSEFTNQLFNRTQVMDDKIWHFSCGHVIGSHQLLPLVIGRGPNNIPLKFTYQNREDKTVIDELGHTLVDVCKCAHGGVVCFFSSYDVEQSFCNRWISNGTLSQIEAKKKVFRESRQQGCVDLILSQYKSYIENHLKAGSTDKNGAILFSVVGGKMSEGINFSDDLGRCVIIVGMPYPNLASSELQEKMSYLDANFPKSQEGKSAGKVHYENLCMKAVNQSIGRAIRHKDDYAAILLLDSRYSRPSIIASLPSWISSHLVVSESFSSASTSLSQFFLGMRSHQK